MDFDSPEVSSIIDRALQEDIRTGDVTSVTLFPDPPVISAVFLAQQEGLIVGLPLLQRIFRRLDSRVIVSDCVTDGSPVQKGTVVARVKANAVALLSGERVALNFLQRLSGIATQTNVFAKLAAPSGIKVLDTRKTTPTLRVLEKYAVQAGGGVNHRTGLYDAILVKDNHLKLQPDFAKVLAAFEHKGFRPEQVEVEVTSVELLSQAILAGVSRFLLDNMEPADIMQCVRFKKPHMYFEVSGGVNKENFSSYLISGVDAISIGALTHSVMSLDISMELE